MSTSDDGVCPKCGSECHRDEVDVGVGVIHGPWGCPGCGWSSDPQYDCSGGKTPPAAAEYPNHYVDQFGGATPKKALKEGAARFGFDPAVIDEVFGPGGPEPEKPAEEPL